MNEIALSEILASGNGDTHETGGAKAKRRQAILDSARGLIEERGGPEFTVAELADRAGVSRRTVFNHFSSVDDVIAEITLDEIGGILQQIAIVPGETAGVTDASVVYDQIAAAFRNVDLADVLFRIQRAMGGFDIAAPAVAARLSAAFMRVEQDLSDFMASAYPDIDPLDVRIAVMSLIHGLAVIAPRWASEHPDGIDQAAREDWDRLMDHLIDAIAAGYHRD